MFRALVLGCLAFVAVSHADEAATVSTKVEKEVTKPYGVMLGIGKPYPTILGLIGAYNLTNNWRASIAYGEVEVTTGVRFSSSGIETEKTTARTYSAGMEYLFLDLPVQGVVGLHGGYFDVKGKGELKLDGFDSPTGYVYSNFGIDWLTESGFQLGGGLNVAFAGATGSGFYLNSGYFF